VQPPLGSPLSIETASFPRFAVEDSGITGQLQLVQTVDASTLLALTVYRLGAGEPYSAAVYPLTAAVYVGTCRLDRPALPMLEPVDRANDPFVSITDSTITFAEHTQGDHVVDVFDGGTIDHPDGAGLDVLARSRGEVWLGAIKGRDGGCGTSGRWIPPP